MRISPEIWQATVSGERRGASAFFLRRILGLASWPYSLGVWGRNKLFDWGWKTSHRAGIPVVSVGNLTLGGTGKTPCVEYVAGFYRQHEHRVAILSRGYGAEGGRNDEAMLLEENLPDVPHLQDRDRVALAATAVEELESEILVLDDGFQHRRLARDLDIVLIDATNPWGFGRLFPRGALREPAASLRRAGIIVITRADRVQPEELWEIWRRARYYSVGGWLRRIGFSFLDGIPKIPNPARTRPCPVVVTRHMPIGLIGVGGEAPLEVVRGRPTAAFAGIGNPMAFRKTLEDVGAAVTDFRTFPDHHGYTKEDVDNLRRWADQQPAEAIIATTQKDFVKLRIAELAGRPLWAVRIGLSFVEGQEVFDRALRNVMPISET